MSLFTVTSAFEQDALLLDQYPTASAAYSVRKLRTEYTGPSLRVRRSNDNATQDIGFINGALDTTQLRSFVSTNSAFVDVWYDQSGNSNNLTMPDTTRQPRIVNAGTIESASNRTPTIPALFFDGVNDYITGSNFATGSSSLSAFNIFSSVTASAANTTSYSWYHFSSGSGQFNKGSSTGLLTGETMYLGVTKTGITTGRLGSNTYSRAANAVFVESEFWTSTGVTSFQNTTQTTLNLSANGFATNSNVSPSTIAMPENKFVWGAFNLVAGTVAVPTHGKCMEMVYWGDNKSSERIDIQNNMNQYFNIY